MKIGQFEVGDYVVKDMGGKRHLVFDCRNCVYGASLAEDRACMFHVLSVLQEVDADLIVFAEVYERVYDEHETKMLTEVSSLIRKFENDAMWSYAHLGTPDLECEKFFATRHDAIVRVTHDLLAYDPVMAYLTCLHEIRTEQEKLSGLGDKVRECNAVYLATLTEIKKRFESTELIGRAKDFLQKLQKVPESREIYRSMFEAEIKPSFIGSRLLFGDDEELELLDEYNIGLANVQIFKHPNKTEALYFVNPPEYSLPPEKYFILSKTKEIVASYKPGKTSLSMVAKSRKYFTRIYESTIHDIAQSMKIPLSNDEARELAEVVARYTVGYGILELVLQDKRLTDIYVDAPIGMKPIYVVHSDYGQCQTNIVYTADEANSMVSKLRAMSGRPFDEAHPVLDFDLDDSDARVAVIGPPLSPDGIAFAFRLHKVTPWTLPQFIDNHFMTPLSAGLLSFFIDQQATTLVTGSRGAGKTSLLQALMLEILQNTRIILQEDSVTGDSKIQVKRKESFEFTTVGALIDEQISKFGSIDIHGRDLLDSNPEDIHVYSMDKSGKIVLARVSQFSRHAVTKDILEVRTKSGRTLKVTCDHSLFALDQNAQIVPIKTSDLTVGKRIAVPSTLPNDPSLICAFPVLDTLVASKKGFLLGSEIKPWIAQNWKLVKQAARENGYKKNSSSVWKRKGILPVKIYEQLRNKVSLDTTNLKFKIDQKSRPLPLTIPLSNDWIELAGLWLADGCYDSRFAIIVSVGDAPSKKLLKDICDKLGLVPRIHHDQFSTVISNTNLVWFFKNILHLKGNAYTKQIPNWAFNLDQRQKGHFLKGLFSGDGNASQKELGISLCSKQMIDQLQTLLLHFGITARVGPQKERDKTYRLYIGGRQNFDRFKEKIGFLQIEKTTRLELLCTHRPTQDATDTIPLGIPIKKTLARLIDKFSYSDYITRGNNIGRRKLSQMLSTAKTQTVLIDRLNTLVESEILWDEVTAIQKLETNERFVYDFSVPGCENFICENIIAHNTLEIPAEYMKNVGFNIQRLKTRSPISVSKTESEVGPEESLRTALREDYPDPKA